MEEIVKKLKQDGSPFAMKQLEVKSSMSFLLEILSLVLWFLIIEQTLATLQSFGLSLRFSHTVLRDSQ